MADDPIAVALTGIRKTHAAAVAAEEAGNMSSALIRYALVAREVPALLAALDAVLALHKPMPVYGLAFDAKGNPRCTHDPDTDPPEHVEDGYGDWHCTDLVEGYVCESCGEDDGCGLLAVTWPCLTYVDILAALTGRERKTVIAELTPDRPETASQGKDSTDAG